MKKLLLPIVFSLCLTYSNAIVNKINFTDTLAKVNYNNESFGVPDVNFDDYINEVSENDLFESSYINKLNNESKKLKSSLSKTEALEDVDFLFKVLKNDYILYTQLGGDNKFQDVKENIKALITDDEIATFNFFNILADNLNFINDNHFYIKYNNANIRYFTEKSTFFIYDNEYYYYDDIGFYTLKNGSKNYIFSINDDINIEEYMYLSIADNGELVYKLGSLLSIDNDPNNLREKASITLNVTYCCNGFLNSVKKELIRSDYLLNPSKSSNAAIDITNDIPIISLRSFGGFDTQSTLKFYESSYICKDYDINILDLRGNKSVSLSSAVRWLYNRFDFIPDSNSVKLALNRLLTDGQLHHEYDFKKTPSATKKISDDFFSITEDTSKALHKNDSLIFVLTDINNSIVGELFIDYLKSFQNVVIVGTNTSQSPSLYSNKFTFPNSQIELYVRSQIAIFDENYYTEHTGFKPDIWVNGSDALDKTLKLIKYYNLK